MSAFLTLIAVPVAAAQGIAAPPPPPAPPPPLRGDARYARPPRLINGAELIGPDDYPAAARAAQAEGRVRYAVDVSARGAPTACRIVTGSGDPALDAATCQLLLARARFVAALDRDGRAVAGTTTGSIAWRLPVEAPVPAEPPRPR